LLGAVWTARAAPVDPSTHTAFLKCAACQLALVPHRGEGKTDDQIRRTQERIASMPRPAPEIERLGWLFVEKARRSSDPGFYKLAEQCALCLEAEKPRANEALLLRGHVLHSLHQFKEAETLARELVQRRGLSFDYGLLGDILLDQGRMSGAIEAYQKMLDERPDLHGYTRAAHIRWVKGDLEGALEMITLAIQTSSSTAPEAAAWVYSRAAIYLWQAGRLDESLRSCDAALRMASDYAPALLARGRILLGEGKISEAVGPLEKAAEISPLPELQWALADALRAGGRTNEALAAEAKLHRRGALADGRTYALFLATRGERLDQAIRLAEEELKQRGDGFTHDAKAWVLSARQDQTGAAQEMRLALAEGTQDARLFFHAGVIASRAHQDAEARSYLDRAAALARMLYPSERVILERERAAFNQRVRLAAQEK